MAIYCYSTGFSFPLARREAIDSVLGDLQASFELSALTNNNCAAYVSTPLPALNPHFVLQHSVSSPGKPTSRLSIRQAATTTVPANIPLISRSSAVLNLRLPLCDVILTMQKRLGAKFQVKFSQYIKVVDIPDPIERHPRTPVPVWPPEPIYFNNILDLFADRRRVHVPMHELDTFIDIYDLDGKHGDPYSKGARLLQCMDEDSDNDSPTLPYLGQFEEVSIQCSC